MRFPKVNIKTDWIPNLDLFIGMSCWLKVSFSMNINNQSVKLKVDK